MSWKAGRMSTSKYMYIPRTAHLRIALNQAKDTPTKLYSINTVREQSWVYEKDSKMIK